MFDWLRKQNLDPRTLDAPAMAQYAMKKGCPVCKTHPMQLLPAPGSGNGEMYFARIVVLVLPCIHYRDVQ